MKTLCSHWPIWLLGRVPICICLLGGIINIAGQSTVFADYQAKKLAWLFIIEK